MTTGDEGLEQEAVQEWRRGITIIPPLVTQHSSRPAPGDS